MKLIDPTCHHELTVLQADPIPTTSNVLWMLWCPICKHACQLIYKKKEKGKRKFQWL